MPWDSKELYLFYLFIIKTLTDQFVHRLISLEVTPRPDVQCEAIAWRLVGLLGADQGSGLRARTARLASALVHYTPDSRDAIDARRRQLDGAVQGKWKMWTFKCLIIEYTGVYNPNIYFIYLFIWLTNNYLHCLRKYLKIY